MSKWVGNGNLLDPAGTAVNVGPGNGHSVAPGSADRLMLRVTNTHTSPHNAVIKAGTYPPAIAAGQGDLTVPVANATTQWIGPLESGRFAQADGTILVDLPDAAHIGAITAFLLPKAV
jgi:hypothetical protein